MEIGFSGMANYIVWEVHDYHKATIFQFSKALMWSRISLRIKGDYRSIGSDLAGLTSVCLMTHPGGVMEALFRGRDAFGEGIKYLLSSGMLQVYTE